MTTTRNWVLALAVVVGAAACGTESSTKGPSRDGGGGASDAEIVIGPSRDGGLGFDGGIAKDTARMLNVVGSAAVTLEYGQTHTLTAMLVGVGVGAIANEPVTFVLTGGGSLNVLIAQTNAAGLASVQYTAPKAVQTATVTTTAAKVASADQATWVLQTVEPQRILEALTPPTVTLASNAPVTLMVRLQQRDSQAVGHPLAGGQVAFTVISGSRGDVTLNRQSADTDTVVTGIDGVARLALNVASVASDYTFTIAATEDYSTTLLFKVNVKKDLPCTSDADCRANEKCDTAAQKCVVKPQCSGNSDCSQGYVCSGGQCALAVSCSSSSDCVPGWVCDPSAHQCTLPVVSCSSNAQCTSPQVCDLGKGQCVYPTQILCDADGDCPAGYRCDGVRCTPRSSSTTNCTSSDDCGTGEFCDMDTYTCVVGCAEDYQCFPLVCDLSTGNCVDAPVVVYDVSGDWSAVQTFHVAGLLPDDVQSALTTIDTIFGTAQAIVDCHVSQYLPGWLQLLIGGIVDDAVCGVIGTYVPEWVQTVAHIGADVSTVIQDFEIHSDMTIAQPGTGKSDQHTVSGVDDWRTAYFFWYTNSCKTNAPGQAPPDCARVEVDLSDAAVHPSPSAFTGRVDGSTLSIDTHQINFKFGKAVLMLIDALVNLETNGQYHTLEEALVGFIDCAAVNSWIQGVVADILGNYASYASWIDVTGVCNDAKDALVQQLLSTINGLNADVPMSLTGQAGVVILPGNTSNVADRLAPGVWYGKFNGQGDEQYPFGEWYADRP